MMGVYSDMNRKGNFVPAMSSLMNPSQIKFVPQYNAIMMPTGTQGAMPNNQAESQDKILKDQNFLSSDDKLYESIIHHGLSLKNIFAECQFSEKLLGNYLFRAIKKAVYDPNIIIFKEDKNSKNKNQIDNFGIKQIEIVESSINDIIQESEKIPKIPDTSSIFEKVLKMKENKSEMVDC